MKRFLTFFMFLSLLLGLCACGAKEPEATGQVSGSVPQELETTPQAPEVFRVGFSRVNITGSGSLPLAGYGNTTQRMSQGLLDYICTTCIAITDENNETVLMYTTDHVCTNTEWMEDLRGAISQATGVPAERIMLSATHTHSGPDVRDVINQSHAYYQVFKDGLVQAGTQAMADRSAATVYSGSTNAQGLNFVRHYNMSDGKMAGDNYGDMKTASPVDNHHPADDQVQLIRFVREAEDKKDIVMMNFQVHPKLASTASSAYGQSNRSLLTSDVVGATRDYVEKTADVHCAYYQGAAGNLNPLDSYIMTHNTPAQQNLQEYGKALGGAVVDALPGLKQMTVTPAVSSKQMVFEGKTPSGSIRPMEIDAVRVGDIGFVTVPFEMFDTTGISIKTESPFETTFVITYANGRQGYLPSQDVWDYKTADGSVAYELTICYFAQGTAEQVAQELVSMLNDLKG